MFACDLAHNAAGGDILTLMLRILTYDSSQQSILLPASLSIKRLRSALSHVISMERKF